MKYISLIVSLALCTSLTAFKNIEIHKKEIGSVLQKHNPESLKNFKQFTAKYDQLVISFFDTGNNLSLANHIERMQSELVTLNQVANDSQFISAKPLFSDLNKQLCQLITVLKQYVSSKNSIGLAFKVRKFKKLLPCPLNKWTDFSLFLSLNHRLNC